MEEEFENQLHKFVEFEQKLIDVVWPILLDLIVFNVLCNHKHV
jgi:hypothetical protein